MAPKNQPVQRVEINPERLWRRHLEMAELGATGRGGVNRAALTPADIELHARMAGWARQLKFEVELDAYGNQFMRRLGTSTESAPFASGSHSDTQPTGGRFDGIFGVLAAFEALEAIEEANLSTKRPLEAVIWNNEEGTRFEPTAFGSAVYVGRVPLSDMLKAVDRDGTALAEAVEELRRAIPWAARRDLGAPISAFLEAHIEQGPELEAEDLTIGLVTGIQGTRQFKVEVNGEEAHAGTTPQSLRQDAFVDAVLAVNALHEVFHEFDGAVRFTIGQFEVWPGASAVVPGRVTFTIDFRHPEGAVIRSLGDRVESICQEAVRRCAVRVQETSRAAPVDFRGPVPQAIELAVNQRGYPYKSMYSGAGHDARFLAGFCPTGMLFVPCEKGISHNERENAHPDHLAAGAQIIADCLLILDREWRNA